MPTNGKRDAQRRRKIDRFIDDPKADPPLRRRKAYIIEVGYSSETRYPQKIQEKKQQHDLLVRLLETEGFEAILEPIVLGTTGGIFTSTNSLLRQLGIEKTRLHRLNKKLHLHSILNMHNLIKLRRVKEAETQHNHANRKKKPPDKGSGPQ